MGVITFDRFTCNLCGKSEEVARPAQSDSATKLPTHWHGFHPAVGQKTEFYCGSCWGHWAGVLTDMNDWRRRPLLEGWRPGKQSEARAGYVGLQREPPDANPRDIERELQRRGSVYVTPTEQAGMMPDGIRYCKNLATARGSMPGVHHKQWMLDLFMKYLLGPEYDSWAAAMGGKWDKGIAP